MYYQYDQAFHLPPHLFDEVWQILSASFPPTELRVRIGQQALLNDPRYGLLLHRENEVTLALLAYWKLKNCLFIEHLAVRPDCRCAGLGSRLLQEFLRPAGLPVVLEAEPAETELAARRLNFYRRHGFTVNEGNYIQPPLRETEPPIPLMLLSYPLPLTDFSATQENLYREVYRCALSPESLATRCRP